jgi:hypothetical protein
VSHFAPQNSRPFKLIGSAAARKETCFPPDACEAAIEIDFKFHLPLFEI